MLNVKPKFTDVINNNNNNNNNANYSLLHYAKVKNQDGKITINYISYYMNTMKQFS